MIHRLLHLIQIISGVLSLTIFSIIVIIHTLHLFLPQDFIVDPKMFTTPYKILTLSLGLLLACISWFAFLLSNTDKINTFQKVVLKQNEKICYAMIAFFIASAYKEIVVIPKPWFYLVFTAIVVFFYVLIPELVKYFAGQHAASTQRTLTPRRIYVIPYVILSSVLILLSILIIGKITYNHIPKTIQTRNTIRRQLHIIKVTPDTTTHAETVQIEGYNFGWPADYTEKGRFKVMSEDGEINQILEWTDNKVTITVPLHLKTGTRMIWIARPQDPSKKTGKSIMSNKVPLVVYSRFDFYPIENEGTFGRGVKKMKRVLFEKWKTIQAIYSDL